MTVVIDCNVLVVCLTSRSPYHHIYQALVSGKINLAVTPGIMLEYEEIIAQKYGTTTGQAFLALLTELPNVILVHTFFHWHLISADPDDNKYCDCAIAGNADFLVTEDKHFSALSTIPFPKIEVIGIDEFSKIIA